MKGVVLKSFLFIIGILFSSSTIVTDSGCTCALTKSATTTPSAGGSINVGCSFKTDWNGQNTEWCLADQTTSSCGTLQNGFGWVDGCTLAGFPSISIQAPPQIEWDQTPDVFYTGQTMNISWTYQNILPDEWLRIQYAGTGGTRTLTTGSGVNITAPFYAVRLSDASNMVTTGKVPLTLNLPSTAAITNNSQQTFQVIQSKLLNVAVYDGTRLLVSGQSALLDDRQVQITWRGLGEAQFGTATVAIKSQAGSGGTTVGTSLTGIPVSANMTVNYTLPRGFNPSVFTSYGASISVQEPGGSAYTATSGSGFTLQTAPTQTPTPSTTPTASRTPTPSQTPTPSITPSPSVTRTPTPSVSVSNTPTPSITPTQSPTPSTTETARPSIDIAGIARAAAEGVDTQTPVIAAVVGTIAFVAVALGGYRFYYSRQMTKKRLMRLKMSAKIAKDTAQMYNLDHHDTEEGGTAIQAPSVVMYTLNVGNPKALTSKTQKREFTPVQTTGRKK